eukprot:m.429434 g.429434  ORF g.429434 m.429434 type:complete len:276 (-) comp17004_c0_seq1:1097-1924(-)
MANSGAPVSPFVASMVAGAAAGAAVDVSLFPLDTLKTRLQAAEGFWKAGGFRGIYNGVGAAFIGGIPGAALFFTAYDTTRLKLQDAYGESPAVDMVASSVGETVACLARVPTENVKQKQQAGVYPTLKTALRGVYSTRGIGGFYVGYGTTLAREIPFSLIQFPLWEAMKREWALRQGADISAWQSAICGSSSGALAAAVTTPLDVCKTRLMLDMSGKYSTFTGTLKTIYAEEGMGALFAGVQPRVFWISLGGLVFFGAYEKAKSRILARPATELD